MATGSLELGDFFGEPNVDAVKVFCGELFGEYVTVDIWLPCLVDLLGDAVAGTVLLSHEDCLIGFDTLLCFLFFKLKRKKCCDNKMDTGTVHVKLA